MTFTAKNCAGTPIMCQTLIDVCYNIIYVNKFVAKLAFFDFIKLCSRNVKQVQRLRSILSKLPSRGNTTWAYSLTSLGCDRAKRGNERWYSYCVFLVLKWPFYIALYGEILRSCLGNPTWVYSLTSLGCDRAKSGNERWYCACPRFEVAVYIALCANLATL